MPGPRNKVKGKSKTKKDRPQPQIASESQTVTPEAEPAQCLTFQVDEETLCWRPATQGYPPRCDVHRGQFQILYKRYADASKEVDQIKWGRQLPASEQIRRYTDWSTVLEKARLVRQYIDAIRIETEGSLLHARRFLDDAHKARMKFLQKEMANARDTLDKLHTRAYELYISIIPSAREIAKSADARSPSPYPRASRRTEDLIAAAGSDSRLFEVLQVEGRTLARVPETGNEDLIEILLAEEETDSPCEEATEAVVEMIHLCYQQFARRIIFHEPTLFMKSLRKTSLDDFFQSNDFDAEDAVRFIDLFTELLGSTLTWCKDAIADALTISREGSEGSEDTKSEDRLQLLGGYIFKATDLTNESWWYLLKLTSPPNDMEHRFVRLCQNFDDLITFLSFCVLGLVPPPSFCRNQPGPLDPSLSRLHLSLCGVVVADMVSPPSTNAKGPVPTSGKARKHDCIVWAEHEARVHLFAAIRNESDAFTDAFIRELRARPDLFQVIVRSETDPDQVVAFGAGPGEALPSMRIRTFEAPPAPASDPPKGDGEWKVKRTALDLLYGTTKDNRGYFTVHASEKKWFFRFKTFPVKYLVVLDAIPNRDHSHLARNLAWAALCAKGYGEGEYTLRKYAEAGDKVVNDCAEELFGWMPVEWTWSLPLIAEQLEVLAELEFGDV
ncbi:hypothetical protein M404DRAFT_13717 [Pisolithus tinctorius Marx 270]|uniref:Uncharacterized protein n=1 Tax=Pisolithus tinctorius Marx 270 TaxID=870435 RepID=A0A0C3PPU0_PISTI|nr:hypothetical protein M404DRAFT_13717 [Pisolithus tinctorius Marx 270]